jgi:hypothetical protein
VLWNRQLIRNWIACSITKISHSGSNTSRQKKQNNPCQKHTYQLALPSNKIPTETAFLKLQPITLQITQSSKWQSETHVLRLILISPLVHVFLCCNSWSWKVLIGMLHVVFSEPAVIQVSWMPCSSNLLES